jgi:hypothetical protein
MLWHDEDRLKVGPDDWLRGKTGRVLAPLVLGVVMAVVIVVYFLG